MRILSMRTFLFVIAALLLSATTCSCSREDDPEEQKEEQEDKKVEDWENEDIDGDATMAPAVIKFSVGNMTSITRGATLFDGTSHLFSEGDRITIEMYRSSEKVGTKKYKVVYDETEAKLKLEFDDTGLPFAWENTLETVKLRAWSYGTSEAYTTDPLDDENPFSLNKNQAETTAGRDNYRELLYSPQQDYDYTSGDIELKLYHQMSRLTVSLTHSKTSEALAVTANSVIIGDGTLPISGRFIETGIVTNAADPEDNVYIGSWENDGFAYDTENNTGKIVARTDAANEKYSVVLFPGVIASGKRLITLATADGTFAYKLPSAITLLPGKQYNYSINVKDLVPVTELTISEITGSFTYNGSPHTPEPATVKYGDKVLDKDTDYELEWLNNTNAGTATCRVKGKGGVFTGHVDKTFTISAKPITITASAQTVTYGTAITNNTTKITSSELVSGHSVSAITLAQSTTNATTNGTIIPSAATIKDGSNNDVTSNYNISYSTGLLTINRKDLTGTSEFQFASGAITRDYIWEIATMTNALTNTKNCTVTYTSSNTGVATVSNASTGTLLPGGTLSTNATITATIVETGNYKGTATYTIRASSKEKTFNATGSLQTENVCAGKYKLEVWGAEGSTYSNSNNTYSPGKGGYSYGNIQLNETQTLNVCVGKQGLAYGTADDAWQGKTWSYFDEQRPYNGGGHGHAQGGGATHIAASLVGDGQLYNYSSSTDQTKVYIVAGGGGGNELSPGDAGAGGGTSGGDGIATYSTYSIDQNGKGGSQTGGGAGGTSSDGRYAGQSGSFGRGGHSANFNEREKGAGGGGGWYGGGGSFSYAGTGGGGSGHIGSAIISGTSGMSNGVRSGNGQAKITWVSN